MGAHVTSSTCGVGFCAVPCAPCRVVDLCLVASELADLHYAHMQPEVVGNSALVVMLRAFRWLSAPT